MAADSNSTQKQREGASLVLSIVFILIFSALAVSMAATAGTNTQLASTQYRAACALTDAASGLEVQRYWLSHVRIPSSTPPSAYFNTIVDALRNELAGSNISNITLNENGLISPVAINLASAQHFTGQILMSPATPEILQLYTTGGYGQITRTIGVYFDIEPYEYPVFNFALATKGPLNCTGNPAIRGVHAPWEANLYIESTNTASAAFVGGNADFDGDIMISNPTADVNFAGDVRIAGADGQRAINDHIVTGVNRIPFPIPDTTRFRRYATGKVIDFTSDLSRDMTLKNATIEAGTNPHFAGRVTIQGILLVKSPNIVTFGQDVDLQGLIVAEGKADNPGTNRIDFCGNLSSGPYPDGAEFDPIRGQTGSSILAPGFATSFQGDFFTFEGVVAASGVRFCSNVNAVIKGTIINYSESPVIIEGDAVLHFDRQDGTSIPAGFDSYHVLTYNPSSYEVFAM